MIDQSILDNPDYALAVKEFTNSVRMYWRLHIEDYFNKRTSNYDGLERKINHRVSISTGEPDKTLRNVLEVNWHPESGHVMIQPGKLMVMGKSHNINLINILVKGGTRTTPMRYCVAVDARMKEGSRKPQTNKQWIDWMNVFIPYVDSKLEELADATAEAVADSLVEEF